MSPVLTTLIATARANNDGGDDVDYNNDDDDDYNDDIEDDIEDDIDINVVSDEQLVEPTADETEIEEIEQQMRDLDQVVESFKDRVKENWHDPL